MLPFCVRCLPSRPASLLPALVPSAAAPSAMPSALGAPHPFALSTPPHARQQVRWGANKRIRWTGKKGNKNFYKGTRSGAMGHYDASGCRGRRGPRSGAAKASERGNGWKRFAGKRQTGRGRAMGRPGRVCLAALGMASRRRDGNPPCRWRLSALRVVVKDTHEGVRWRKWGPQRAQGRAPWRFDRRCSIVVVAALIAGLWAFSGDCCLSGRHLDRARKGIVSQGRNEKGADCRSPFPVPTGGRYIIDPWKVRDYVVPDLSNFKLTPFVSPKVDASKDHVPRYTYKDVLSQSEEGQEAMDKVSRQQLDQALAQIAEWARKRAADPHPRQYGVEKPPLL